MNLKPMDVMARTLKSIPMSLVPFHYHKLSLSECAQSATTSDVMAINNGLTQRKMDLLRILLSVSGVDHFAVHESNASSRNKPGRYCWPIRTKLEYGFWPVLAYIVTSHEHLFVNVGRQSDQRQPRTPVYPHLRQHIY